MNNDVIITEAMSIKIHDYKITCLKKFPLKKSNEDRSFLVYLKHCKIESYETGKINFPREDQFSSSLQILR